MTDNDDVPAQKRLPPQQHTGIQTGGCSSESLAISISHGRRIDMISVCGYDARNPAGMPAATPNRSENSVNM